MSDLYFQVPAPSYAAGYTLPMVQMWDGLQLLGEITPEQVQQLTAQRDALAAALRGMVEQFESHVDWTCQCRECVGEKEAFMQARAALALAAADTAGEG